MTNEEKQLLLKDLCERIPYEPVVNVKDLGDAYLASVDWWEEVGVKDYTNTLYQLDDIKPYLRPMSSMTEEEERTVDSMCNGVEMVSRLSGLKMFDKAFDYLNAHYLDYHGLIEKGLALEAPEGMYKTE